MSEGLEKWVYRVHVVQPPDRDVLQVRVLRYSREGGYSEELCRIGGQADLEWHRYKSFDQLKRPTLEVDGLTLARLGTDDAGRLVAALKALDAELGVRDRR